MIKKLSLEFNFFLNIIEKLYACVNLIKGKIKTLHLYLIKGFLGYFIFGIIVFSILLLIKVLFTIMDMLVSKGVALFLVLKIFIFYLPNVFSFSIPMAALFGVLMAYGRLSSDNEITAMKSSGLDYKTLTIPIITLVCIISLFLVFFNHLLAPSITSHQKILLEELITKRPLIKFNAKSVKQIGNYSLYANKVNNKDNTLFGVSIYKFEDKDNNPDKKNKEPDILPQKDKRSWRIAASSAKVKAYENGVQLTLHNGYWQKAHPSNINNMTRMTFKTYVFFIPLGDVVKDHSVSVLEMKTPELIETIKQCRSQGIPTTVYEKDLWFRWVLSFAPLAFVIIALPTGIMFGKGGKAISFGINLGVILIYYTLLIISLNLGEKEYLPFGIIMWLSNFVITTIGIYLFRKMVKR